MIHHLLTHAYGANLCSQVSTNKIEKFYVARWFWLWRWLQSQWLMWWCLCS
ncbi:hypothetical protein JHK86_056035 [Glycine max]|nr:hypothetical protein JHK86_056035 [Glycine max]